MRTFGWLVTFGIVMVAFNLTLVFSNIDSPVGAMLYNTFSTIVECVYFGIVLMARYKKLV